jgi:hypothetical protein
MYTPKTAKGSSFKLQMDTLQGYKGKNCIRWDVKRVSKDGGRFTPGLTKEISVKPGEKYALKFWVKSNHVTFNITLMSVSDKCSVKEETYQVSSSAVDYWEEFTLWYTVPNDYNKVRVEFSIATPGKASLDEVSFAPVKKSTTVKK